MAKAKVLIVDDDKDIRESLQDILEGKDYSVVTAADKTEGLAAVRAEGPDLIILDVMMTTAFDGLDVARELKKDPEVAGIPILMLTGIKEETGIPLKPAAGDPEWCPVEGFLEKPVKPDVLIAEIEKLLSGS